MGTTWLSWACMMRLDTTRLSGKELLADSASTRENIFLIVRYFESTPGHNKLFLL